MAHAQHITTEPQSGFAGTDNLSMPSPLSSLLSYNRTFNIPKAINWNEIQDPIDLTMWNRLNANMWWPEKVAISKDSPSWFLFTPDLKLLVTRVFTGLTLLDTIQAEIGTHAVAKFYTTPHERAIYNQIAFMEDVHARSYSSIFSTLCSTPDIREAYLWSENNKFLQKKAELIVSVYAEKDPHKTRIASVFLESFLFYSGFYLPLFLSGSGKLSNTANIIKLIIRDEALHGYYVGYKYQQAIKHLSIEQQDIYRDFAYTFLMELYDNEINYTEELYDSAGLSDDVKRFLHYNGNKALMNLGLEPLFAEHTTFANPIVIAALKKSVNHDFFSLAGSTYKLINVENMEPEDYKDVLELYAEWNT